MFNISISTGARGYKNPHWESPYEHWLFEAYEKVSYIDLYFQQKRERERKKELNFQKLREISKLGENWNGYEAEPFSPELIIKMCRILNNLHIQPEIFPTAIGSIQLEYEKDNGDYLEFQVTEEDKCSVFESFSNGTQKNFCIPISNINEVVDEFYE